jgi:hypothetical protein
MNYLESIQFSLWQTFFMGEEVSICSEFDFQITR